MSARKLRPTGKRLLVLPAPPPERTATGILLAQSWQQPTGQGTVVAVGNQVEDLQPGDTVFYSWVHGQEVIHEERVMRLLHREEILAKQSFEPL
jgi:co-chaperonin GroES (HSP10)